MHLGQWVQALYFDHIPSLKKLARTLLETIRYLELNADSMPRAGQRISTGFVESAVNEIVAKRMVKKRQMRWEPVHGPELSRRSHSNAQWHLGRRIPSLTLRL